MISAEDLLNLVNAASNLQERMENVLISQTSQEKNNDQVEERLLYWIERVSDNNREKWLERLNWSKWTEHKAKEAVDERMHYQPSILPSWSLLFKNLYENFHYYTQSTDFFFDKKFDQPIAFQELLFPFILLARKQLFERLKISTFDNEFNKEWHSTTDAYFDLERQLLKKLSQISVAVFYEEFSKFRPNEYESLLYLLDNATTSTEPLSKEYYSKFLSSFSDPTRWLNFFTYYAVLTRLMFTAILHWTNTTEEFFNRLKADFNLLNKNFLSGSNPTDSHKIKNINAGVADLHNEGRSVFILTFTNEVKIIYKPKDVSLENAFQKFQSWCQQHFPAFIFKSIQIIEQEHYGWIEYINSQACQNTEQANEYYGQAGMLLCILYILGANDCHGENIIAHATSPVLIDAETLMHPNIKQENMFFWSSVLTIGLLPQWFMQPGVNYIYDISGLGSFFKDQKIEKKEWFNINTDDMYCKKVLKSLMPGKNIPLLNNSPLSASDYVQQILAGFKSMYHFFLVHKKELLKEKGIFECFKNLPNRYLLRATNAYALFIEKTLEPRYLTCGVMRSLEFELLARWLFSFELPLRGALLQEEQTALEVLNIPYLAMTTTGEFIFRYSQSMKYQSFSGYEQAIEKVKYLSTEDLEIQTRLIAETFALEVAHLPTENQQADMISQEVNVSLWTDECLLHYAATVAEQIKNGCFC